MKFQFMCEIQYKDTMQACRNFSTDVRKMSQISAAKWQRIGKPVAEKM